MAEIRVDGGKYNIPVEFNSDYNDYDKKPFSFTAKRFNLGPYIFRGLQMLQHAAKAVVLWEGAEKSSLGAQAKHAAHKLHIGICATGLSRVPQTIEKAITAVKLESKNFLDGVHDLCDFGLTMAHAQSFFAEKPNSTYTGNSTYKNVVKFCEVGTNGAKLVGAVRNLYHAHQLEKSKNHSAVSLQQTKDAKHHAWLVVGKSVASLALLFFTMSAATTLALSAFSSACAGASYYFGDTREYKLIPDLSKYYKPSNPSPDSKNGLDKIN